MSKKPHSKSNSSWLLCFRSSWSKWKPMYVYTYDWFSYLVQAKISYKTGEIKFKTTKINGTFGGRAELKLNFDDQFKALLNDS